MLMTQYYFQLQAGRKMIKTLEKYLENVNKRKTMKIGETGKEAIEKIWSEEPVES